MSTQVGSLDGSGIRVALVVSRFNDLVTAKLLSGAEDCLERHGCTEQLRTVVRVPGSWELPLAAKRLAERGGVDAIVALGALIRGETPHFDYLAAQVARGVAQIGLDSGIPTIFGVLTTDTLDQAMARAGAKTGNKGWEAALSALEMVNLFREIDRRPADAP
jgi:6,7-dimethyl-8-ribityllumazine synthase